MLAGFFTSVTPVEVAAEEEQDRIRLLDVSLIVVGPGEVAAELVRRRRLEGGRVCWLQTQRQPRILAGLSSAEAPVWATGTGAFSAASCSQSSFYAQVNWDPSNFSWKPPLWHQPRWQGRRAGAFRGLGHTGWASHAWMTRGPEIARLQEEESYCLTPGDGDRAPAIQVVHSQEADSSVSWEISGVVVFAGEHFRELRGAATVCETAAAARELDVGVVCEDAKPFATVRPLHVLMSAALTFVQFVAFFLLMGTFEPYLAPGATPWWRASFMWLTSAPFAFSGVADIMGPALTGAVADRRLAATMAAFFWVALMLLSVFVPIGWIGDTFHTLPLFIVASTAFAGYLIVAMSFSVLHGVRRHAQQAAAARRKIRWRAHFGWFLWIVTGTFGTWLLLYAVALLYVYLSGVSAGLSAIALPLMTSSVEVLVVSGTVQAYKRLVLGTRRRNWGFTVFGDQRELMIVTICQTHSCAESARLVSMLVPAVKSAGLDWIPSLLLAFLQNVLLRTNNIWRLLFCLLPSRYWWMIAPDAGTVLHNEVRVSFGYLRFVPVLALGLANLVMSGFRDWPIFNVEATLLVVSAVLLEMAEDAIVISGVLQGDSWKAKLACVYRGIDPLHPDLAMGLDRDGIQPSGPAISFSGMRFLRLRTVLCVVQPACFFAYSLLTLLLGAGFVHRVCSSWIQEEYRLIDGLVWWLPLRC